MIEISAVDLYMTTGLVAFIILGIFGFTIIAIYQMHQMKWDKEKIIDDLTFSIFFTAIIWTIIGCIVMMLGMGFLITTVNEAFGIINVPQ